LLATTGGGARAAVDAPVLVGEVKGIINRVMAGYASREIEEAERTGATAVVSAMAAATNIGSATPVALG
jgi:membrane-bound ClpP family serine protease